MRYVEAALTWWQGRSPRERVMLGVMGALLAAVIAWYLVIAPALDWRADAAQRRTEAEVRLTRIEAAASRLTPTGAGDAATVQTQAQAAADAAGLAASFSAGERGVDFTVASAPTAVLFGWIAAIKAQHGLEPVSLAVTENADATLTAQGTLAQSSAR
jgi:general secretion pathway protein M